MAKRLDLTGQTFGKLTAMTPAPSENRRSRWNMRCECGNTVIMRTVDLRDGFKRSCGCMSHLRRYRPPIVVPDKGHSFVRQLWHRIAVEQTNAEEVAKRAGVHPTTIRAWRTKRAPRLPDIEAVIQALGGRIVIRWDAE